MGKTIVISAPPVQDAPGPGEPWDLATGATRAEARLVVATWLRGRAFSLGHPEANAPAAEELLVELSRHGFGLIRW
jgi:hypothetical protein